HWRLASQPGAIGRCPSIEDDPRVQSVLSAGSRRATRRPAESLHVIEVAGMTAARVALACGALTNGHGPPARVGGERETAPPPLFGPAHLWAPQGRQAFAPSGVSAKRGPMGPPLRGGRVARRAAGIKALIHAAAPGMNCAQPAEPLGETAEQSKRLS